MLYPTLTKTRSLYDLSGLWQFKLGDHNPEDCLSTEDVMVVPTSFNDVVVDKDKRNYIGDFWYERLVDLPKLAKDDELILRPTIKGTMVMYKVFQIAKPQPASPDHPSS